MDYDIFNDTSSAAPHSNQGASKGQAQHEAPQSHDAEDDVDPSKSQIIGPATTNLAPDQS